MLDTGLGRRSRAARVASALDGMSHGLCLYDAQDRLELANLRFAEIYRQPAETLRPGTRFRDMLAASIAVGNYPGRTIEEVWRERKAFIDERKPGTFLQALGDGRLIAISHRPLPEGGWVAIYEDVTERRRTEMQLQHMARHDALTMLPNRLLLGERLEEAFAGLRGSEEFALLCLDLDGFKPVNDMLGHAAGDALLRRLAERLLGELRPDQLAARLGGDEFAVLLPGSGPDGAAAISLRIAAALSRPYDLGGIDPVTIGVSIGVACAPRHATTPEMLLEHADGALYAAKRAGLGRPCLYGEHLTLAAGTPAWSGPGAGRRRLPPPGQPMGFEALLR